MKLACCAAVLLASLTFQDDNYVYHEDPCVEALKMAMVRMEPFIPLHYTREGEQYVTDLRLSRDEMNELLEASQSWREVKMQCWRSS